VLTIRPEKNRLTIIYLYDKFAHVAWQTTSSPRAPAKPSSLHSCICSLLVASFRSAPFRISNLEPLLQNTRVGGTSNFKPPRSGVCPSSLLLITYPQAPYFHAIAHSSVRWESAIPSVFNTFRTLSIAIGVVWYPSVAISPALRGYER